ncbi:hypothetical protein [Cupriavidus necator]|uniref:hypothetical protein n=1 Tax=Cupriavidus necator TaxID=106590 RepID=UPI002782AB9F|nr:hypothetical protein [Cupriavidus necator]MDQ0142745.1 hypothetical protein [Cupriavidus necator]
MASRNPRRPGPRKAVSGQWWQPGVYGSVPAVALWILARLPAGLLMSVTGMPAAPAWLNLTGDTVFVTGWVASALLLWFTGRRPAPSTAAAEAQAPDEAATVGASGSGSALRG